MYGVTYFQAFYSERLIQIFVDYHRFDKSEINEVPIIPRRGHSIVKNTGGWLDSLGSGILVGKVHFGFFKNIDLNNSWG